MNRKSVSFTIENTIKHTVRMAATSISFCDVSIVCGWLQVLFGDIILPKTSSIYNYNMKRELLYVF